MREFGQLRGNIFPVPIVRWPIVNTVEVHTSGENIRVARQAHGGKEPAVAAAPQADACGIDIAAAPEIFSGGDDILIFRGATASAAGSLAKRAAIPNAAAIVDGEHDVAAAGEILVHGVGIR